jgi:glucose-6-phosphate isomerase
MRVHVIDNADPWQLEGVLDLLDPKTTAVFVVSKSGTTAETLCGWRRVRDWLTDGGADWKAQALVCTDAPGRKATPLWRYAEEQEIHHVGMPEDVGGRFCVLTPVGIIPALAMGFDVEGLLDGAREMVARCRESEDVMSNPALLAAAIAYTYFQRPPDRRRNITVVMPYAYRLRLVGDWFAQLWSESLGKRRALDGSRVVCGMTPVKALGATDQHSQLQLYQEGPQDKVIFFLRVMDHARACPVPDVEIEGVAHLGNRDLGSLLDMEYRATAHALAEANRPSLTIELPEVSARAMGELFAFFMLQTAIAGELFRIDAFDQPGVESSKRSTHALCGKPGPEFDELREEIADAESGRRLVL